MEKIEKQIQGPFFICSKPDHEKKELIFYCKKEKVLLCGICITNHFDHADGNIEGFGEEKIMSKVQKYYTSMQSLRIDIDKQISDLQDKIVQIEKFCVLLKKTFQKNEPRTQDDLLKVDQIYEKLYQNKQVQIVEDQYLIEENINMKKRIDELIEENLKLLEQNQKLNDEIINKNPQDYDFSQQNEELDKKIKKYINENQTLKNKSQTLQLQSDKQKIQIQKYKDEIEELRKSMIQIDEEKKRFKDKIISLTFPFDSIIIRDPEVKGQIIELIYGSQGLRLLFRGSKDGFKARTFHKLCGNQGATLTIIQSKDFMKIFGGFTDISWSESPTDQSQGNQGNKKSFIFSQDENKNIIKLGFKKEEQEETVDRDDLLSCFGWSDLCIKDDCNINKESWSNIGSKYKCPQGVQSKTEQSKEFLAGSYNFFVQEIEVFQVLYSNQEKPSIFQSLKQSFIQKIMKD